MDLAEAERYAAVLEARLERHAPVVQLLVDETTELVERLEQGDAVDPLVVRRMLGEVEAQRTMMLAMVDQLQAVHSHIRTCG